MSRLAYRRVVWEVVRALLACVSGAVPAVRAGRASLPFGALEGTRDSRAPRDREASPSIAAAPVGFSPSIAARMERTSWASGSSSPAVCAAYRDCRSDERGAHNDRRTPRPALRRQLGEAHSDRERPARVHRCVWVASTSSRFFAMPFSTSSTAATNFSIPCRSSVAKTSSQSTPAE
jgi:hypothetical protein